MNTDPRNINFFIHDLTSPYVFSIAKDIKELIEKDIESVTFELSARGSVEPFGMLLVGSVIRQFCADFNGQVFINFNSINSYAGTMGFYQYAFPGCSEGKAPGEALGSNRYIPISEICINKLREDFRQKGQFLEDGHLIEKEAYHLADVLVGNNKELKILLTYLLREMMRNTPEHAESPEIWICAQFWPKSDWAEIALLDEGIGVFQSLTKNPYHRKYINDEKSALHWATKAGISQAFSPDKKDKGFDDWSNSGFGLYMASQICKKLGGEFHIASKNNYLAIEQYRTIDKPTYCLGTAVRMRIKRSELKTAAQLIIDETRKEAELQAKGTRTAFKQASLPSRGLMERLEIPLETTKWNPQG